MKTSAVSILLFAVVCFCSGCRESIPPKPAHPRAATTEATQPKTEQAATDASEPGPTIRGLIRALAEVKDQDFGLSSTMSGSGFAPVPRAGRMSSGILMNHGLKDAPSFLQLVEIGPPALPYLLESITDKTPTKLTIDYSRMAIGGMWYGERPALRWAAEEAYYIRELAKEKESFDEFTKQISATPEFIEFAKGTEVPFFLPQPDGEFNPKNLREKAILAQARKHLIQAQGKGMKDSFEDSIHSYTISIGDVCYVIIGQITNRTYMAAQYQSTACTIIISPARDAKLAADVRAAWASTEPTELVYHSLLADCEEFRHHEPGDALVRLGYYFPERSEELLLKYVAKVEAADKESREADYEGCRIIRALLGSRNHKVRDRLFSLLKTAQDPYYFLELQEDFGKEHDPLILKKAMAFIDALPKDKEGRGDKSLLVMMGERFPQQALPIYKEFVASPSTQRRDTVINALWNSNPLAPELLLPLLDDKRLMNSYTAGDRVCDRAAQAISHATRVIKFDSDFPEATRDELIQKIKQDCAGIGARKTPAEQKKL